MKVPEPVKSHEWTRWELIPAALVLGFALNYLYSWAIFDDRPPLVPGTLRMEVMNSPLVEGQELIIRAHREKVRDDCLVESTRWAIDQDGLRYDLQGRFGVGGQAAENSVDLIFKTNRLPPGDYLGSASATYHCPGWPPGGTMIVEYPTQEFRFRVVKGKK